MCLYVSLRQTAKLKKSKAKFVYRWKGMGYYIDRVGNIIVHSPYVSSFKWKVGFNKSTGRPHKRLKEDQMIERGIHVCRQKASAVLHSELILRVKCYLKDLIAVNEVVNMFGITYPERAEEEVYTQVYVEETDYNKLLRQIKKLESVLS